MHLTYDWCKSSRLGRPFESYAANYEASSALAIPHMLPDITKMETVYADQLEKAARS
jgi:hypothetical protein